MGTVRGVFAILPDWHSATFRPSTSQREKALTTEKCLKGGSKYSGSFGFSKFRLTRPFWLKKVKKSEQQKI